MADESMPTTRANATGRSSSSVGEAPPGYGLRRAATVDEATYLRRRSTLNPASSDSPFGAAPRRSSIFSNLSSNELGTSVDDLLNLSAVKDNQAEKNPYAVLPLVLALLPAVGGLLFEGGSAFFTDVILLGLAAIFLHWSVTQPWNWYHSAQETREAKDVAISTPVFESDSEQETSPASATTALGQPGTGENGDARMRQESTKEPSETTPTHETWDAQRDAAVTELYIHERLALAWCFIFPVVAAYLLHTIRGQLSRPSEGLVCDYNLCIFIIAAEIRPVAHLIRLAQSRTLRKQRIVSMNPYAQPTITDRQLQELSERLAELEAQLDAQAGLRSAAGEAPTATNAQAEQKDLKAMETLFEHYQRDNIQPELDALNRAVRRYEKKLSVIVRDVEKRLEYLDGRLNDAVALAAVAAKHSYAQKPSIARLFEWSVGIVLFPIRIAVETATLVCTFPFRTVSNLLGRKSKAATEVPKKTERRTSKGRISSDRVPARMSKR